MATHPAICCGLSMCDSMWACLYQSTSLTFAFLLVHFNLELVDFRLQVLSLSWCLDTQYPIMWDRHLHQQRIHTHWQDICAGKLTTHKAMLVHSLSMTPSHLQQVVHSSHTDFIRCKLAHVQQNSIPVIFTVYLREAPLELLVDAGTNVITVVQDRSQQVFGTQCWEGEKGKKIIKL